MGTQVFLGTILAMLLVAVVISVAAPLRAEVRTARLAVAGLAAVLLFGAYRLSNRDSRVLFLISAVLAGLLTAVATALS